MVNNKTKKGLMKIKWDNRQLSNHEIFDHVAGKFLLKYCCREDDRLDKAEGINGNDSKLIILSEKNPQIVDVSSIVDDDNTILCDNKVRKFLTFENL